MHVSAQNTSSAQFEEIAPDLKHLTKGFSMLSIKATAILLDEVMDQALWLKNS